MRLDAIEISSFRNIAAAHLTFTGSRHFFLGPNGQGKTNLLEAVAFSETFRSFRGVTRATLVQNDAPQATLRSHWTHEQRNRTTLGIALTAKSRRVILDGATVNSLEETLGIFPVVALTLADRELIYGGPSVRRREIDKLFSQLSPTYYRALKEYTLAAKSRLQLLTNNGSAAELTAFEEVMGRAAIILQSERQLYFTELEAAFRTTFARFAPSGETPALTFTPSQADPSTLPASWKRDRARDTLVGSTASGPHRDKITLHLNGQAAEDYASEGQKFSLVLALKLAGLTLLRQRLSIAPVIVADDLLLELDPVRQERFWGSVDDLQVFASGTTLPPTDRKGWQIWSVSGGVFTLED